MEPAFGHDFGAVRIHTDEPAAESARAVGALAYTVGPHVVFARHQYAPRTSHGQLLLAHELTHVLQVSPAAPASPLTLAAADSEPERHAEATAAAVVARADPSAPASAPPSSHQRGTSAGLLFRQQATGEEVPAQAEPADGVPGCSIAPGIPNSQCGAYLANAWWLPLAYANNATCACRTTPNTPTASCVRSFLQARVAATPAWLKVMAVAEKPLELNAATYAAYQAWVQAFLTPRIYQDHVDAYATCCCPSGPAAYPAWIGVTSVPIQPCSLVGDAIMHFGSCHGTPGSW